MAPLVAGPTTAVVTVNGDEVASVFLNGNSRTSPAGVLIATDTPPAAEPTATVQGAGTVDNRGRIRIRGNCNEGGTASSADGLTCNTSGNGSFSCRGRFLTPGDFYSVTCSGSGSVGAGEGTPVAAAAAAATDTGTADASGRTRINGVCSPGTTASSAGLECRTRGDGRYRCNGANLAPGSTVQVSCN